VKEATMAGQDNLHIVRESFAAWNAHDAEAFTKRLDAKTTWESDVFPKAFSGHDGARQFFKLYITAFPDLHLDIELSTNPFRAHARLTEDADQLTTAWTAGDYRRTAVWLGDLAADAHRETVEFAPPGSEPVPLFHRPTVVRIPDPPDPEMKAVLEDLTLTTEKLAGQGFWRYVTWADTPVIVAGGERLSPSNAVIAVRGMAGGDHMLRLAALVDAAQYVQVSGARESRMIAVCRQILEPLGWSVTPRLRLTDPPGDVDVYAVRERDRMVVQLKSTLRPQSPWEVYKRNGDILDGIEKANRARRQLGEDVTAVVITDGYRGDYATWRVALDRRVATGTLEDLDVIARDPARAFEILQQRAGFGREPRGEPPHERTGDLLGWSLRIVDAQPDVS
jgi:ketosteroid isomerase-like protein